MFGNRLYLPLLVLVLSRFAMPATAQVVQLPSFQQFSASTTVVVPDGGAASLGGVKRAASGSNQFGRIPGNRAFGRSATAGGLSVTARIHDFEAMDRALLENASNKRGGLPRPSASQATRLNSEPPVMSIAEIRRRKAAERLRSEAAANTLANNSQSKIRNPRSLKPHGRR